MNKIKAENHETMKKECWNNGIVEKGIKMSSSFAKATEDMEVILLR
jgi:hypothetical protein